MIKLTSIELRQKWISFFQKHQHYFLAPRSLIPDNDPSLLFINSGVATLKPYFSGQLEPPAKNLVNCQKVIRTNDVENVGKTSRHHTLFEMLGSFSIGGYFKVEAVKLAYDFLINELGIKLDKLYFTVYSEDHVTYDAWLSLGVLPHQILKCGRDRNFWDVGSGPCGACSEIYYDRGEKFDPAKIGIKLFHDDIENDRYIEIWNIVFSEFNNNGKNEYSLLSQKNIDTGAGFERILSISQDAPTNFDTDLFLNIIHSIQNFSEKKYEVENYFKNDIAQSKINTCYRIIADHLRAICLAIADGVIFDNKGQGYVLRRLMRRVIAIGRILEFQEGYLVAGIQAVNLSLSQYYTNLEANKNKIDNLIFNEYNAFLKTWNTAWKILNELIVVAKNQVLDAYDVFKLVETYGFPKELLDEILVQRKLKYSQSDFEQHFSHHQEISKKATAAVALAQQNETLMALKSSSVFLYDTNLIPEAKVIHLFDLNWKPVDKLDKESGWVVLNQTCLYATSGGQEHDCGWIQNYKVNDVIKAPNLQHLHKVENASLRLNELVEVKLEQNRRKQLSRQHSSEHLLHAALKHTLSSTIKQEGAYKAEHKISLDFRYHIKPTESDLKKLEMYVLQKIAENHLVTVSFTTVEEAKKLGASAYFEDTYKKQTSQLRLVKISDDSLELCGGTHVNQTSEIGDFLLLSLESKGAGSWRIEAVSGENQLKVFLEHELAKIQMHADEIYSNLRKINLNETEIDVWKKQFKNNITKEDWRANQKNLKALITFEQVKKAEFDSYRRKTFIDNLHQKISELKPVSKLIILKLDNINVKWINTAINTFVNELENNWLLILNRTNKMNQYYLGASKKFWTTHNLSAALLVEAFSKKYNYKGGGRIEVAQGSYPTTFDENCLIDFLKKQI